MSLVEKAKNKIKNQIKTKAKKAILKAIKPFLPYILIIGLLFFAICSIIDAVFVQEVQTDDKSMPEAQLELKQKCITKAEEINTCNNFIGKEKTNYLLDVNDRETSKMIEWSHLYAIMAFKNMSDNSEINENLLNEVANKFTSNFVYEKSTTKIETTKKDDKGKESKTTESYTQYILIESDTIMGHYKYNYEETTIEKDNVKTTKKVYIGEELIGEKYERLKKYLREDLKVEESDIEADTEIVIQAANGYYEGEENTSWLQQNNISAENIITDGKGLVPTRYVYMADSELYKNIFSFWYEGASNNESL